MKLCAIRDVAAPALRSGGLVAFPTDTIFGVGALLSQEAAVRRLYALKGRSPRKPVAICVASTDDVGCYARTTFGSCTAGRASSAALAALLPGATTVLLERLPVLPAHLNPGHRLVGLRVPDHPLALALVRACGDGAALALSSANESGAAGDDAAPRTPHAFRALWPGLAAVLDEDGALVDADAARPPPPAAACTVQPAQPSTVVDLSVPGTFRLVRGGAQLQQTVATLEALGLGRAGA